MHVLGCINCLIYTVLEHNINHTESHVIVITLFGI